MEGSTFHRSLEQRQAALARANEIRTTRAVSKQLWKAGAADPLEVVRDPPAEFESMKVWDVLRATPGVGKVKADKALRSHSVSPSKTLGGLSVRQRQAMLANWPGRS